MLRDILWFLLMLLALLAVRQFLFEPVRVKGSSMLPTLKNGQWLLVSKLDYQTGEPMRGDVIICHYPNRYMDRWKLLKQYFVKRVIGLPGETIEILEGIVHINGEPIEEPYLDPAHTRWKRSMPALTLEADEYFVMGDNRDSSNDSRRIGPITRAMIVGHVQRIVFPFTQAHSLRDR